MLLIVCTLVLVVTMDGVCEPFYHYVWHNRANVGLSPGPRQHTIHHQATRPPSSQSNKEEMVTNSAPYYVSAIMSALSKS